jgi:hypothetical protein
MKTLLIIILVLVIVFLGLFVGWIGTGGFRRFREARGHRSRPMSLGTRVGLGIAAIVIVAAGVLLLVFGGAR